MRSHRSFLASALAMVAAAEAANPHLMQAITDIEERDINRYSERRRDVLTHTHLSPQQQEIKDWNARIDAERRAKNAAKAGRKEKGGQQS